MRLRKHNRGKTTEDTFEIEETEETEETEDMEKPQENGCRGFVR